MEGLWIVETFWKLGYERMVDGCSVELEFGLPVTDSAIEIELQVVRNGGRLSLILRLEMAVMASKIVSVEDENLKKIERCLSDVSWMKLLLIYCKLSL